jgi:para-nitrobenzyl esterase
MPLAEATRIFNLDNDGLHERVTKALGAKGDEADRVIDVYRRSRPNASPTDLLVAITTAQWMWSNAITLAERKVDQNGAPVYMYMFAYESEVPVAPSIHYPMKSPHAMKMAFKFNHPDNNPERARDRSCTRRRGT